LKTEVGGRKGRHKPAIQGRKPKRLKLSKFTAASHGFSLPQLGFRVSILYDFIIAVELRLSLV